MSLARIMVVIDPATKSQLAFKRGLDCAIATGAKLHLYACLNNKNLKTPFTRDSTHDNPRDKLIKDYREELYLLAAEAQELGVDCAIETDWADNCTAEIVHAAARSSSDMVIKTAQEHSTIPDVSASHDDWHLILLSSCPVLIVKSQTNWQHRSILAAIKCTAKDAAHIKLDHAIISFAQRFTDAYGTELHFVSASMSIEEDTPKAEQLAAQCGVPVEQLHFKKGVPAQTISDTAKELQSDLIIIGTLARSSIDNTMVGDTTVKLLALTQSDVLILN
jgi:universal stress protein E